MKKHTKTKKPRRPVIASDACMQDLAATSPLNRQQDAAARLIRECVITFLVGPAGTGKTHIACTHAARMVADAQVERVVLTRPVVEAGESLGYLPGTYEEKAAPYLAPIYDVFEKVAGRVGRRRDQLNAAITIAPIAYLRGRTFDDAIVILDEAQNCTSQQLRLVISRLGKGSQLIVTGDMTQSDLPASQQALGQVVKKLRPIAGIGLYEFDGSAIVRHPILTAVLEVLK